MHINARHQHLTARRQGEWLAGHRCCHMGADGKMITQALKGGTIELLSRAHGAGAGAAVGAVVGATAGADTDAVDASLVAEPCAQGQ